MNYCTNCGAKLSINLKFCGECGQKIELVENAKSKKIDLNYNSLILHDVFEADRMKYGFINHNGDWVIQPQFDSLTDFQDNGLASAKINEKWGAIDSKGNWVIQPQFDYDTVFQDNGLATNKINGKWGVHDSKGNWVIQPQFDKIWGFWDNGLASA